LKLSRLDLKIIYAVNAFPTKSFASIAKKVKTSPQTVIRRIQKIKQNGLLRNITSSYNPSVLGLDTYYLFFFVSNKMQQQRMKQALHCYPYIKELKKIYGRRFGFFSVFAIPRGSFNPFYKYIDYLFENNFFDDLIIDRGTGQHITYIPAFPESNLNKKNFSLFLFKQELLNSDKLLQEQNEIKMYDISDLSPMHFLLLHRLNRNFSQSQKQLVSDFRNIINNPKGNTFPTSNNEYLVDYLSEYFNRKEPAIRMDMSRKYTFVLNNFIDSIQYSFNPLFFSPRIPRYYLLKNITEEEKAQILNFIEEAIKRRGKSNPSLQFQLSAHSTEKGLLLYTVLPYFYDAKISKIIWKIFPVEKSYMIDIFSETNKVFPFNINNVNLKKQIWKTDIEWMFEKPRNEMK